MNTLRLLSAVMFLSGAAVTPSTARAETDACSLLTREQIGAAVGVAVAAGQHVTATYVKTCTWSPSTASDVKTVTLFLQSAESYNSGKQLALQMAAGSNAAVKSASVGEDSYYFVLSDQAGLLVRKGGVAFKVTVYAKLPVDKKEAMELSLARDVVAKL
jgi:hypothetical protein